MTVGCCIYNQWRALDIRLIRIVHTIGTSIAFGICIYASAIITLKTVSWTSARVRSKLEVCKYRRATYFLQYYWRKQYYYNVRTVFLGIGLQFRRMSLHSLLHRRKWELYRCIYFEICKETGCYKWKKKKISLLKEKNWRNFWRTRIEKLNCNFIEVLKIWLKGLPGGGEELKPQTFPQ